MSTIFIDTLRFGCTASRAFVAMRGVFTGLTPGLQYCLLKKKDLKPCQEKTAAFLIVVQTEGSHSMEYRSSKLKRKTQLRTESGGPIF